MYQVGDFQDHDLAYPSTAMSSGGELPASMDPRPTESLSGMDTNDAVHGPRGAQVLQLQLEIRALMDRLAHHEQRAHTCLADQRAGFKEATIRFERKAREVAHTDQAQQEMNLLSHVSHEEVQYLNHELHAVKEIVVRAEKQDATQREEIAQLLEEGSRLSRRNGDLQGRIHELDQRLLLGEEQYYTQSEAIVHQNEQIKALRQDLEITKEIHRQAEETNDEEMMGTQDQLAAALQALKENKGSHWTQNDPDNAQEVSMTPEPVHPVARGGSSGGGLPALHSEETDLPRPVRAVAAAGPSTYLPPPVRAVAAAGTTEAGSAPNVRQKQQKDKRPPPRVSEPSPPRRARGEGCRAYEQETGEESSQSPPRENAGGNSVQPDPLEIKRILSQECKIEAFPTSVRFRTWKMNFKKKIASISGNPDEAFLWINEIEEADTMDELAESGLFPLLDSKIASGLSEILNGEFQRQVQVLDEKAAIKGRMLKGRQIAWLIYQHFRLSEAEGSILEFNDLLSVELRGDNLMAFKNDWEMVMSGLKVIPSAAILESLVLKQLQKSHQLKDMLALYHQDVVHRGEARSYERIMKMVTSHLEFRRRQKTRDDMSQNPRSLAQPSSTKAGGDSKPLQTDRPKQGDCRQFLKTGSCSRGKACPWKHEKEKANARRPRSPSLKKGGGKGQPKSSDAKEPRAPTRRGRSPSGKANVPPCRFHAAGTCNKGADCEYWHVPACRFHKNGNCVKGKNCLYLHVNTVNTAQVSEDASVKTEEEPSSEGEALQKTPRRKSKAAISVDTALYGIRQGKEKDSAPPTPRTATVSLDRAMLHLNHRRVGGNSMLNKSEENPVTLQVHFPKRIQRQADQQERKK